jgi:hypothetical protein
MSGKLPRLWDERITTAKGRKMRRYGVRWNRPDASYRGVGRPVRTAYFTIWDKLHKRELPHPDGSAWQVCVFRERYVAENFLKRTTVRSYELARLNHALDRDSEDAA